MALSWTFYLGGYIIGLSLFAFMARRRGIAIASIMAMMAAGLVGGLTGATLLQWIVSGSAGRTVLGALVGGYTAIRYVQRRVGITGPISDMLAVAACAGEAVGRWSCFFGGCCYGRPTGVAWAVWQHDAFRHPTQLYLSLANLFILFLLWCFSRTRPPVNGLFFLYATCYCAARFLVEFLRDAHATPGGLSIAQWACLLGFLFFLVRLLQIYPPRASLSLSGYFQANKPMSGACSSLSLSAWIRRMLMQARLWLLTLFCLCGFFGCAPPTPNCAGNGPIGVTNGSGSNSSGNVIGGTRRYTITDLGTLGGPSSAATAINDNVQVVGSADLSDTTRHAFLWQAGKMTDLGTLGGKNSAANAISLLGSTGDIAGTADLAGGAHHAFVFHNGVMTDLGTLGGSNSTAMGIGAQSNPGEQVVGASETSGNATHAFRVTIGDNPSAHAALIDLGTLGGKNSSAFASTFSGNVLGSSDTSSGETHAVLFRLDTNLVDLGTLLGGGNSVASATLFDGTRYAGTSDVAMNAVSHACLFIATAGSVTPDALTDIGTLGGKKSAANAINTSGVVVGVSDTASGPQHAFIYASGLLTDLNSMVAPSSGWVLETANGINSAGYIVGTGTVNGVHHAYLLTPS